MLQKAQRDTLLYKADFSKQKTLGLQKNLFFVV